ncbi:FAD/NAD(P)-binding domain-containing protein [Cryphonectria parasitica EP155]|uniref:FAD/NAD(P)-binding domain-containing protein n=1 Tax=Cryphonectria parasitica (strain ATCC 38755 / EP155) TaxID=660469 RepID=A0A9P4XWB5_CRYP1|nr:FAD/NAD(P)-binding domain-containing protein [Cryphonectria parasitica EP155]KAF3762098.1 FAD/NAD(P)-binding domain-containing protein [Cryphonectria parasitica EP155]
MAFKILINGAGVAGTALAAMLLSSPVRAAAYAITVVERAPALRTGGQQVDLRAQGIPIMQRIGLLPAIRARCAVEEGLALVDTHGSFRALLGKNKTGRGRQALTSELEIMRGELVDVLYQKSLELAAKGRKPQEALQYGFGKFATEMHQHRDGVDVVFSDGSRSKFDLVVGADGLRSSTRRMAFGAQEDQSTFASLGVYMALFNIPRDAAENQPEIAKMYNAPGRRSIATRTGDQPLTQVVLSIMHPSRNLIGSMTKGIDEQKAAWAEAFRGAGWKTDQLLDNMLNNADFFYAYESAQIKLDHWHDGRIALLGDAGYCPSPNSGLGTTGALVGAFVLAGELAKQREGDVGAALRGYETVLKPFVTEMQKLPPGIPRLFYYETQAGIWLMHRIMGALVGLKIDKLLYRSLPEAQGDWEVPDYPQLEVEGGRQCI